MWDWYVRPGDWRTRGGRSRGLVVVVSLAAVVGAALFVAAFALVAMF